MKLKLLGAACCSSWGQSTKETRAYLDSPTALAHCSPTLAADRHQSRKYGPERSPGASRCSRHECQFACCFCSSSSSRLRREARIRGSTTGRSPLARSRSRPASLITRSSDFAFVFCSSRSTSPFANWKTRDPDVWGIHGRFRSSTTAYTGARERGSRRPFIYQ